MRVLIVLERHKRGGGEEAALRLSEALQQQGHTLAHFGFCFNSQQRACSAQHYTAIALGADYLLKPQGGWRGLFYNPLSRKLLWLLNTVLGPHLNRYRLRQTIRDFQPDVVHFHCGDELNHPAILSVPRQMGVASILTVHSTWIVCPSSKLFKPNRQLCAMECSVERHPGQAAYQYQCIPNPLNAWLSVRRFRRRMQQKSFWRDIDMLTAPSQSLLQQIQKANVMPENRLRHIPYVQSPYLQERALSSQSSAGCLFVGRLLAFKGLFTMLEAWRHLPHIPLMIVGEGPLYPAVKQFIQQYGMHHVTLLGWQQGEALWQLYQKCTAVVVPTDQFVENFPVVIMEASAFAKPCLVTDLGGMPEMVKHQQTGWVLPHGDSEALRKTVEALWQQPQLVMQYGEAARQWVNTCCATQTVCHQTLEAYQAAIQHRKHVLEAG